MELFLDALLDALIDGVKMLPFLYLAYLLIEWLERHHGESIEGALAGGGVFLLARWLPLVRLDLGGTLVLVVLLALSAPILAGLVFMGERLHGMVNDWKNKKARKHV